MTICAHTLVKNGMPFIGPVLKQVIPYVNRCMITISEKSTDGTIQVLKQLQDEYPKKIVLSWENVAQPSELTVERQKQIDRTTEDWILFLDDDDYWPSGTLELTKSMDMFEDQVDAIAFNPYQIIDKNYHDDSWRNKWFTKLFRNRPGLHYKKPWPRDLIYLGDKQLYWRKNDRVMRVPFRYLHLPLLKSYSFRGQKGFEKYKYSVGKQLPLPVQVTYDLQKIL